MRCLDSITDGHELEKTQGDSGGQEARRAAVHGVPESGTAQGLKTSNGFFPFPPPLPPSLRPFLLSQLV